MQMIGSLTWFDWTIVAIGLAAVVVIGRRSSRYMHGVADFLTAGRLAGRYLVSVSSGEAAFGLISLVALYESYYKSGFAYGFWGAVAGPVFMVLSLTGYCTYRFRETRAMTMGQFLEMRYSRPFRIFAGILQSISGILNYGLFPAVGARFLVYFCGLPVNVEIFGLVFPTFGVIMAVFLGLAVWIAVSGGQISIMATDCIQGLLSYPVYVLVVAYILVRFSWFNDLAPVVTDRPPGSSMINPFDTSGLRDFNIFYVVVGILSGMVNRMSWSGVQGYNASARTPHEQKMGGVLGTWRGGFSTMMYILLAVVAYTYLNGDAFQGGARGAEACRAELSAKAVEDTVRGEKFIGVRDDIAEYLATGAISPAMQSRLDLSAAARASAERERERLAYKGDDAVAQDKAKGDVASAVAYVDKIAQRELPMNTVRDAIYSVDGNVAQTYATVFGQMRVPLALRYILPAGLLGLFCTMCIFLMVSTDTTYLHSWGSILVQDIILPIRNRPFTPRQQLLLLRLSICAVATFAFFFSYFFGQVDYILMFFAITGAIWLGGAGVCIVGGLYWRRGTTAGAWSALIAGSGLSVLGVLLQKNWAGHVYPWLFEKGLVADVAKWLAVLSSPFEPFVSWRMSSQKFPVNSQEIYFITLVVSLSTYVIVSLLTSRGRVFNMDRMLNRGIYRIEGDGVALAKGPGGWRNFLLRLLGIDRQYTRGDRILAWSVFLWSFVWGFGFCFVGIIIWNAISPWGTRGFTLWFYISNFIIAFAVGVVTTIWFSICGVRDLRKFFKDLGSRVIDENDDGRVAHHANAGALSPAATDITSQNTKHTQEQKKQ